MKSSGAKIGFSSSQKLLSSSITTNKQRHFLCSDCVLICCQRHISFPQFKRTRRRNFNMGWLKCSLRWVTVGTWQDQTDCFYCQLYISGLRKTYFLNRYHRATATTSTTQHIITTARRIVLSVAKLGGVLHSWSASEGLRNAFLWFSVCFSASTTGWAVWVLLLGPTGHRLNRPDLTYIHASLHICMDQTQFHPKQAPHHC